MQYFISSSTYLTVHGYTASRKGVPRNMELSPSTPVSSEQEADAALLPRANRNFLEGIWELERRTPGATIGRWQGATAIRTSVPSAVSNVLFVPMVTPD